MDALDALRQAALDYLSSPLRHFVPWQGADGSSPQREFLQAAATHPVRIFRAGNQSGKTTIAIVEALLRLLGLHPFVRRPPPVEGWLVALDWEWGVGQVLWPKMREWIPWDQVRSVLWYRRGEPSLPGSIVFKNGSKLTFKSAETGRRKFQGSTLDFIGLDEEMPGDIVEECRTRLLANRGDLWATLTPLRRERWVVDLEREPGTKVIRASMSQASHAGLLNADAVADYLASLPERQRQVRDLGDFADLEGLVYRDFSRAVHVVRPEGDHLVNDHGLVVAPWPVPTHWPRYAAIDFGYSHPTAIVQAAVHAETRGLIIERVPYCASIRASRWAQIIPQVLPPLVAPMVSDHDRQEREELRAEGIETMRADKDIVHGLEATERWLDPGPEDRPDIYLVVHDDARDAPHHPLIGRYDAHALAWEMEAYRYPPSNDKTMNAPRDLPMKKDDHACDALRYLVMFLDKARHEQGPLRWRPRESYDTPNPMAPRKLSGGFFE